MTRLKRLRPPRKSEVDRAALGAIDTRPVGEQEEAQQIASPSAMTPQAGFMRAALPAHLRGDGPCADCGTLDNPVWFTDNPLWNVVTGEAVYAEDAHGAILCPNCFIKRADAARLDPTGWRLTAEWPWRFRAALAAAYDAEGQGEQE